MKKQGLFAGLLILLATVSILAQTLSSGSLRHDTKKTEDITYLQQTIDKYAERNRRLPTNLDDLNVTPSRLNFSISDFQYRIINSELYEICTEFKTETTVEEDDSYDDGYEDPYHHKKGLDCITDEAYIASTRR